MRFGVASRIDIKKVACVSKWLDRVLKYMITILGSIVNIIGGYQPIWPFNEHKNLHFDNEYDVHMSSKNYEESGYGLNLDSLAISS